MAGHSTGLFCCFLTHFTALDGDDEKEKLFIDRDQVCVWKETNRRHCSHQFYDLALCLPSNIPGSSAWCSLLVEGFSLFCCRKKTNGPPVHFGSVCELTIDGYWVGWEKIFSITCNACMMFRLVLIHHSTCEYLPFPYTSLQYFRVHLAKRSSWIVW